VMGNQRERCPSFLDDLISVATDKYNNSYINDAREDRRDYLKGYMDALTKVRTIMDPNRGGRPPMKKEEK